MNGGSLMRCVSLQQKTFTVLLIQEIKSSLPEHAKGDPGAFDVFGTESDRVSRSDKLDITKTSQS